MARTSSNMVPIGFKAPHFNLLNTKSGKILRSGSVVTFPALSSSSSSLYTNDVSLQHIKERLILSSAKKLYLKIKLIMKKLN